MCSVMAVRTTQLSQALMQLQSNGVLYRLCNGLWNSLDGGKERDEKTEQSSRGGVISRISLLVVAKNKILPMMLLESPN